MIYISVFIYSMSSLFEFLEPSSSLATALIKTTWYTRIIAILMTGIWLNKGNRSTGKFYFQQKKKTVWLECMSGAWHSEGIHNLMIQVGTTINLENTYRGYGSGGWKLCFNVTGLAGVKNTHCAAWASKYYGTFQLWSVFKDIRSRCE